MQQECFALRERQRRDRGGEALERALRLEMKRRLRLGARGGLDQRALLVVERHQREALRAPVVHQAVVRDGVEPRGEFRLRRVAGAGLDGAHPDLLEKLFGLRPLLHRAQHEAEERTLVPGVERLESPGVAAGIGKHELFVGGRHAPGFYSGDGARPLILGPARIPETAAARAVPPAPRSRRAPPGCGSCRSRWRCARWARSMRARTASSGRANLRAARGPCPTATRGSRSTAHRLAALTVPVRAIPPRTGARPIAPPEAMPAR